MGDSTAPVAPQGGVPLTSVTIPQNLALTLATVAGPAVSDPLAAVPTSRAGRDWWGPQQDWARSHWEDWKRSNVEAVNLTLLGTRPVFSDRLPLGRCKEPPG